MLKIGQSAYVEGDGGKGLATVAAYRAGSYVMLDSRNLAYRPERGAEVALRVFSNGSYLNFVGTCSGHLGDVGLLILSQVKQTDINHRRKCRRYFLNLPVPFITPSVDAESVGMVKDISAEGLRFAHESLIDIETPITFQFSFGRGFGKVRHTGRIVRRDELPDYYSYGVLFDDPANDFNQALGAFLNELSLFPEYANPEPDFDHPTPAGQSLSMTIGSRTFVSRIRGYRNREWLITDIPNVQGEPITAIRDGEIQARVRFLREGVAAGFTTTLAKQYTSPAPVWLWSYPDRVERSSVRQSRRLRTAVHADMEWDGGSSPAMMIDISQGGGRLACMGEGPRLGDTIKIAMHLSNGELATGLMGDVRCVTHEKGRCYVGLSFRNEASVSFDRLGRFLDRLNHQSAAEQVG